jgi:hypothetical protein
VSQGGRGDTRPQGVTKGERVDVPRLTGEVTKVVISAPFRIFFPCNHIINVKKKIFFRKKKIIFCLFMK